MTDANQPVRLQECFEALGFSTEQVAQAEECEISQDRPVLAGTTLLRLCWDTIDGWSTPGALAALPAARHLADTGAPVDELVRLARGVASCTLFQLLYLLDEGPNHALRDLLKISDPRFPGWQLVETDTSGTPTGRVLSILYEGLRTADPSGREAGDILDR